AAAWYNSTAATKILLERGANVNAPGSDKFRACFAEHSHVERRLGMLTSTLKNGGKFGTALEVASAFGHIDVVRLLLEAGADAHAHGRVTAFDAATLVGHEDIIRLLASAGAQESANARSMFP
ncbi:hypothetical protein LTR56_028000, partial [Elasticomyces elasticus]